MNRVLDFGYDNCAGRADLDAALAAEAFLFIDRDCLAFLQLKDAHRTNIDTLFVPGALFVIDYHLPGH
jgi:hypothetical protein